MTTPDQEPLWRIQARKGADATSPLAAWLFLAFLSVSGSTIAYHLLTQN